MVGARLARDQTLRTARATALPAVTSDVLRMAPLSTDVPPPGAAVDATRLALGTDVVNSGLPIAGRHDLRAAVAGLVERRSGTRYEPAEVVVTGGEGEAMLDAVLCLTDPGDEVIVTDPTDVRVLDRLRLAGAVPRFVPLRSGPDGWRLDIDALRLAPHDRTRVVLLGSASPPSGWVASDDEWDAIADVCRTHDLVLLHSAAFEAVLFDDRRVRHPASLQRMRDRTVTIGTASFEQRMLGWRIGWIVAPAGLVDGIVEVHAANGVVASPFNQVGVRVALELDDGGLAEALASWSERRDETLRQLAGLPVVPPHGGWALLLDVDVLGLDCEDVADRLLDHGVLATPMRGWGGEVADRHVRFVFTAEPVDRLTVLGARVRDALAAAGWSGTGA